MILYCFCISLLTLIPLLLTIAFFTLAERKIIAAVQRRKGPNVVGYWGLLQPFADGVKLVLKELIIPYQTYRFIFIFSPCFVFIISIVSWCILPLNINEII